MCSLTIECAEEEEEEGEEEEKEDLLLTALALNKTWKV